jgi:hypothetical protein
VGLLLLSVCVDPLAEHLEIVCASIVGDAIERPDADGVVGRDGYNASVGLLVARWRLPPQNQVIACRSDMSKSADVD